MDESTQPGIRFAGVDLVSLHFAIRGEIPSPIPAAISFSVEAKLSQNRDTLDLFVETDVFGNLKPEERPAIDFKFKLHGCFQAAEENAMPLVEFAKAHAPAHLVPYVREVISSVSSRSVLPTLNIGPVNLVALVRNGKARFEMVEAKKQSLKLGESQ